MSAEELRKAAATLRGLVEIATPGPWHVDGATHDYARIDGGHVRYTQTHQDGSVRYSTSVVTHGWDGNLSYIAAMHPTVGLALATAFEELAAVMDIVGCHERDGGLWDDFGSGPKTEWSSVIDIARLINGESDDLPALVVGSGPVARSGPCEARQAACTTERVVQVSVDLTEFLLARIAEDEAVARAASPSPWTYGDVDSVAGGSLYDRTRMIGSLHYEQLSDHDGSIVRHLLSEEADANGKHIARHDPTRVLAEVEAKRRIVKWHGGPHECSGEESNCMWISADPDFEVVVCDTLRALAQPYADHPDFDESWRP